MKQRITTINFRISKYFMPYCPYHKRCGQSSPPRKRRKKHHKKHPDPIIYTRSGRIIDDLASHVASNHEEREALNNLKVDDFEGKALSDEAIFAIPEKW